MNLVGSDRGKTAMFCPREVNHFRLSWVDTQRCNAIMVGSTMLLSVYMPHSGRDEEDYIEALETVRATLTEGKKAGTVDFTIGGDFNIEFVLDNVDVRTRSLMRKMRWLQRSKDFNCTLTSTWTNNEDNREFHTWRAWDLESAEGSSTAS